LSGVAGYRAWSRGELLVVTVRSAVAVVAGWPSAQSRRAFW
jgi:hypothetical protein